MFFRTSRAEFSLLFVQQTYIGYFCVLHFFMMTSNLKQINIADRLVILEKLDAGVSVKEIASEYGVTERTIRRHRQNSTATRQYAENPKRLNRKRQRIPTYNDLDTRLYQWFVQQKLSGDHITDSILMSKAQELQTECGGPSNFVASKGWLWRFKRDYIRSVNTDERTAEMDHAAVEAFKRELPQILMEEDVLENNLYNMDETSLFWRALPPMTLEKQRQTQGKNMRTEKVTVGLCANATGSHKLPVLFVHKHEYPRALKHCHANLPVIYESQTNSCVNEKIFRDWYENVFKPEVRQQQVQSGQPGRVLLLVDNYGGHELNEEEMDDGQFKLILLPANTSSLIQPMEQGVISKCKKMFRHRLLRWALQYEERIAQFYADYDIKDCIDLIHESWCRITSTDIFQSWGKILNRWNPANTNTRRDFMATITEQSFELISAERVDEWIIECEKGEMNTEDADAKDEDCSIVRSPSPIENTELDRLLYNLRKIMVTEPELETQAKSIIDYYDKKNYL